MDKLPSFLTFLEREKGQGERTRQTNLKLIKRLLREISPLNNEGLKVFINNLIVQKRAPSYIKQLIIVSKHWGEFIGDENLKNYTFPSFKYKSNFERETFSDREVIEFLSLPNPWGREEQRYSKYYRNYEKWIIFYMICFYHGLREWEAARLTVEMIKFGLDNYIDLPSEITKTKRPRKVPLAPDKIEMIREYITGLKGRYLFHSPNNPDQHIAPGTWLLFFNKQLKRMNLKRKNLTPYSSRHTYGTRQKNLPLKTLMKLMGHERVESALRYQHPDIDDLRQAQEADRIRDFDKSAEDLLFDVYCKQRELEYKYLRKLHAQILLSEDGCELNITFKVKK